MHPRSLPVVVLILRLGTGPAAQVAAQDAGASSSSGFDLTPRAAAHAIETLPQGTPRRAVSRELSERELSEDVPGLVRLRDATLGQRFGYQFNRVVWRILQFWKRPPDIHRVRYFYIGRSLDVAIHDDGSYDVRDKRGLILSVVAVHSINASGSPLTTEVDEERGRNPEGSPAKPAGVGIGFREPEHMLQRILSGKERPSAEMRTFLEATRPLREHLTARAAVRAEAAARVHMTQELRHIWQRPGTGERKREDTFALWDQCSEDETGALARRHIESFVHELAVLRGECPFAPVDLAGFNRKRRSKEAFSPCDGPEADDVSTGVANPPEAAEAAADRP